MSRGAAAFALVIASYVALASCADDGAPGPTAPREHGGEDVGGQVIATVDGVGITVSDVEWLVAQTELSPAEALEELEERELLAAEARRRGHGARRGTQLARAKARVQRFLEERVEKVVTPASITEAALRERYQAWIGRYQIPELRASTHLLARVPEEAGEEVWARAEAFASDVLVDALAADDPLAFLDEAKERTAPEGSTLRVENLDPYPRGGVLEEAYAQALFATAPGEVHPVTVRTSFGLHVILVQSIVQPTDVSYEEALPEMREALVLEGRAALLSQLLEEAARERSIEVSDPAFARAVSLEVGS